MKVLWMLPFVLLAGCATPAARPIQPTADVPPTVSAQVRATLTAVVPTAAPTTPPTPRPSSTPTGVAVGQEGYLYATLVSGGPAETVYVSDTPQGFALYLKAVRANDTIGVKNLIGTHLDWAHTGYRVLVIDTAQDVIDLAKVRFVDEYFGLTAWTDQSWIVRQLPSDFVAPTPIPTPSRS